MTAGVCSECCRHGLDWMGVVGQSVGRSVSRGADLASESSLGCSDTLTVYNSVDSES